MKSRNRDDIALKSALRGPYYKKSPIMGWYFSRRELGYGFEMTISVLATQGIRRETASYFHLDCGPYRYRSCRHLPCQSITKTQYLRKSGRINGPSSRRVAVARPIAMTPAPDVCRLGRVFWNGVMLTSRKVGEDVFPVPSSSARC